MKRLTIFLSVVAFLLLAGVALANAGPAVDWWVIGGGGGPATAGAYALDGTVGQAVVGVAEHAPYELCTGFWCGAAVEYKIYLPLVLRNY